MGKRIAVDVGYGDTKGVGEGGGRVLFPSVWAPAQELIEGYSTNGDGHAVEITYLQDARRSCNFVGELALRESKTTSFTLDREKHLHPSHDALLLTAVALLAEKSPGPITLGVGLPIDCYRSQADALVNHIKEIKATVRVNGQLPVAVYFDKVTAYLQGVTALLCIRDKPADGMVALVDPGFKTTDYAVFEMKRGRPHLISDMSGSVNIGVSQANELISKKFMEMTGGVLDSFRVRSLVRNGQIVYDGERRYLGDTVAAASSNTARAIADRITESWRELGKFITKIYMIGGVELLPDLPRMLPSSVTVDDPRYANVNAFLRMMDGRPNA